MKLNRKLLEEWRALGEYNAEVRRCILPEEWRELLGLALAGLQSVRPEAARWIPVAERLPDDELTVMIAGKMDEPVWLGFHDDGGWYSVDATPLRDAVTHWKLMPEPPHG